MTTRVLKGRSFSAQDLAPYRGMWVAMRNGRVIASNEDLDAVLDDPKVKSEDEISLVPSDPEVSLFL